MLVRYTQIHLDKSDGSSLADVVFDNANTGLNKWQTADFISKLYLFKGILSCLHLLLNTQIDFLKNPIYHCRGLLKSS